MRSMIAFDGSNPQVVNPEKSGLKNIFIINNVMLIIKKIIGQIILKFFKNQFVFIKI